VVVAAVGFLSGGSLGFLAMRIYKWFVDRPEYSSALLYSLVALGAFVAAYFAIFTVFASYDDEGTLLTTVQAFSHGGTLYRDVYSPYGPFYYELFGGLFSFTGWSVTTDASRLIVVVVWVVTSGLYGFVTHRLTGRLALGISGMIVAFATLIALVNEPMHPHGLASLLIAGLVLLIVFAPGRRAEVGGFAAGVLLAGLVLTKINVGGFAVAAVVLAAVLSIEQLYRRRWVRWSVIVAFLALPLAVMARDLGEGWVRDLVMVHMLTAGALVVAAAGKPERLEGEAGLLRWLLAGIVGIAATFVVVLGVLVGLGLSLGDVYNGVVTDALDIRDAFVLEFAVPFAAVDWAIVALALATIAAWMRGRRVGAPATWEGVLRVAAGVVIWLTISGAAPFKFSGATSVLVVPLTLAWVAALAPTGYSEGPVQRFFRVALPALAIAEVLQVYPVAGSQQAIAAVTFVPVGALCIADGLRILRTRAELGGVEALARYGAVVLVLTIALACKLGLDSIVRPGILNYQAYQHQPALNLPGAGRMHLPPSQDETYESLIALLQENHCTTFISYPGLNSFYLWSSLPVPKPQLPGPWMRLLGNERQQEAVAGLRRESHPCAIRNDGAASSWLQGRDVQNAPLVRYLTDNFKLEQTVGEFQFLVPKGSA
jgi:hypothetical protein